MRAIHQLTGGRLRIWLLSHGRDAKLSLQLLALVGLFLLASSMDYQDQLEAERMAKEEAQVQLIEERAARGLPRVAFVIDADTIASAKMRLAEIEGAAMVERYRMRGLK